MCFDGFLRSFFFFQAEDGIRDGHVTGVQTCALPISSQYAMVDTGLYRVALTPAGTTGPVIVQATRSEERRVGKECRSRWWPRHCRKKGSRQGGVRTDDELQ